MNDSSDNSNPVVHFEMPYDDAKRVAEFYAKAFGWKMDAMPQGDTGDYVVAETTATKNGRPVAPGTINGGFFPKKPDWPAQYPSVVISVNDLPAAMQKVKEAGGQILGEPMDIPGVGAYVSFTDTEGNRVSLLNPGM
jgi:predicted enzyme related to lactoylglutathione lyase